MDVLHHQVTAVSTEGAERATAVLTAAFLDDPVTRWIYPSSAVHLARFPLLVRALSGTAFDDGTVTEVSGGRGAAVWLAPDRHPDEEAVEAAMADGIAEDVRDEAQVLLARMDEHHPPEPHWYLPLIGVDPVHRGTGHGSALLREALERIDADHLPAYLDSTNPRNVPLYERHGFEVLTTIEVGTAPPVVPMLRRAR